MIHINLLAVERKAVKRAALLTPAQLITAASAAILIVAVLYVGWRYRTLQQQSLALDQEIALAQQETARLQGVMRQLQQFEQQTARLQERVTLVEQLRKTQTGPVHLLDQISLALPPMLWLTELKQTEDSVVIDGRCLAITSLTDFVSNLEASGYFKRSVDIVSSQSEALPSPTGEMIRFSIKAQFQQPGDQPKAAG
ncbi:MAG: PilN domain-containing protein [Acidobacteriota bacterium]